MPNLQEMEIEELHELWEKLGITMDDAAKQGSPLEINSLDKLTWAFRKLEVLTNKKAEVEAVVKKEIERIENWAFGEVSGIEKDIALFNSLIESYGRRLRESDPKSRGQSTPYGNLKFKKQQPEYKFDDSKTIPFLEANGMKKYVVTAQSILGKTELKKEFEIMEHMIVANGEVLEELEQSEDGNLSSAMYTLLEVDGAIEVFDKITSEKIEGASYHKIGLARKKVDEEGEIKMLFVPGAEVQYKPEKVIAELLKPKSDD